MQHGSASRSMEDKKTTELTPVFIELIPDVLEQGKLYVSKKYGCSIHLCACGCGEKTVHKCWCRHGEAPNFTVDKNGVTCIAGAGSIQIGNYHGFLQNGFLT